MRKTIIMIIMTLVFQHIFGLTVTGIDSKKEYTLSDLQSLPQTDIITESEKDGELVKKDWHGIKLTVFLKENGITEYKRIRFASGDNYLVRLTAEEVNNSSAVIAIFNDKNSNDLTTRLVVPEMPAMFWIRDIAEIAVENYAELTLPQNLYFAENILPKFELIENPHPFKDAQGYFVKDILGKIFPVIEGEYRLTAIDGTTHDLDFDNFIKEAVLIKTETGYSLQSPQMPGGMWLKDIAYIQKGELAVIFRDHFKNWKSVKKLAGWKQLPSEIFANGKSISTATEFSESDWQNALKMTWK